MASPVPPHFFRQVGVIPHRSGDGTLEVLLITSIRKGRWIIPKGVVDRGETPRQAAIREVREEAGVVGELSREPVGTYCYTKWGGTCTVGVFLLAVTAVEPVWPEADVRQRRWYDIDAAADLLRPESLRTLMRRVPRHLDPNEA